MATKKPAQSKAPASRGQQQQQQQFPEGYAGTPIALTPWQANTLVANCNLMATLSNTVANLTAANAEILSSAGLSLGIETGI